MGEVGRLHRQARVLSHFGNQALRSHDLDALLQQAAELVSEATGVELVKVLQLLPDRDTVLVRAGVNWDPGVVGHATLGAHLNSPAGFALQEDNPVISLDVDTEDRFEIPKLLIEHGVKSMINVVIRGERAAWGVLEVDSRQHRNFDENDISFMQNYANLLASAIDRLQMEAELREAVEHGKILIGELEHRVRNMLLNVRSLAKRIAMTSENLHAFTDAFDARLLALGRTQELLTQGAAVSVRLEDTLRQELKAHGADHGTRVLLSGPELRLSPKAAQALGMAFHELATNASKYGALRHEGARLRVSWRIVADERAPEVVITWQETGVELPSPPTRRRGFGSETIEHSLPYMLGGEARVEFRPDGVECTIRIPVDGDRATHVENNEG
jgi:two-component sensor histidine kinase